MHLVRHLPTEPPFTLAVDRVEVTRVTLSATGEFDIGATEALAELLRLATVLRRAEVRLDLAAVTFLDCSCLRVLLASRLRIRALGGDLVLDPVSDPVRRLLQLTGAFPLPRSVPPQATGCLVSRADVLERHRRDREAGR